MRNATMQPTTKYLLVACGLLLASNARAQMPDNIAAARESLLEDVISLMQTRVLPVMTQWKEQFEEQIPPRDRQALDAARERHAMLRSNIDNNMRARTAAWEKRDYRSFLTVRSLIRTQLDEHQKLFGDVSRIAERNPKPFRYLESRIDSTVEEWRGASMRIFVDWFAKYRNAIVPAMSSTYRDELAELMGSCKNLRLEQLQERAKVAFLLWDGEDFVTRIRHTSIPDCPLTDLGPNRGSILFLEPPSPNSFSESTVIRFMLDEPGLTLVRVTDAKGKEVRRLLRESLPVGKHMVTFRAEDLPAGMYYVTVESGDAFDAAAMRITR